MTDDKTIQDEFKKRVQMRLVAMDKSQSDLATEWKETRQNISALINAGPYVHYRSLEKLAKMLDTSVCWLIEGDLSDAVVRIDSPVDMGF